MDQCTLGVSFSSVNITGPDPDLSVLGGGGSNWARGQERPPRPPVGPGQSPDGGSAVVLVLKTNNLTQKFHMIM